MVLPSLLLQKPPATSKTKDHIEKLTLRLVLWKEGKIDELISEGKVIQNRLTSGKRKERDDIEPVFAKLMFEGKINAALKYLTENNDHGILPSTPETSKELKKKHPESAKIYKNALVTGPKQKIPPSYFDKIDEGLIQKAAKKTKGTAGPSHFDSEQFRRILCNKHFKAEGKHLREQIAIFAKDISINITDPECFESYVACRLIPLNKNPGVRPIAMGEVLRRIIGKAIGWTLYDDILNAAGPLQASAGLKGGAEAAIHAMKEIYQQDSTEGIILVDASNAFNSMNRQTALHNIQYICPPLGTVLINTYQNPSQLFITGGDEILSKEGTTQGDNLAMSFYGLGMKPLLDKFSQEVSQVKQVWLADDASGAGTLL